MHRASLIAHRLNDPTWTPGTLFTWHVVRCDTCDEEVHVSEEDLAMIGRDEDAPIEIECTFCAYGMNRREVLDTIRDGTFAAPDGIEIRISPVQEAILRAEYGDQVVERVKRKLGIDG